MVMRTIELAICWSKNTGASKCYQILRGSNVGKKRMSKFCTWWIKSDAFANFVACFGMAALSIRTSNSCVHSPVAVAIKLRNGGTTNVVKQEEGISSCSRKDALSLVALQQPPSFKLIYYVSPASKFPR